MLRSLGLNRKQDEHGIINLALDTEHEYIRYIYILSAFNLPNLLSLYFIKAEISGFQWTAR